MADFNSFTRQFTGQFRNALNKAFDNQYLNRIGAQIVNQIQVRTRSGFGVARNGARQNRLRGLSPRYIEARREARKSGVLSNITTPARSNLTYTGNMIESIYYQLRRSRLVFGFNNPEAIRVAEEVQSRGRPFFNLSSTEINKLTRQFNARLRTRLVRL